MIEAELDAWWEGHPHSVRLAVRRYHPFFVDPGDFESELYLYCREHVDSHAREHPVSHWLCQRARDLRARLSDRAERIKRDWRIPMIDIDSPTSDDEQVCDAIPAPDYPIDAVLDAERALSTTRLSETQRYVLAGTACGFSVSELAGLLGLSEQSVRRARCEGRKTLALVFGS